MTSTIRVGQSKFVTVPIDEDSQERILNCVQTLSELKEKDSVNNIFLEDTKAAYAKMVATEEVRLASMLILVAAHAFVQKKVAEKREKESKAKAVQVDDVLSFRQFSKKSALDGADDVCPPFDAVFGIVSDLCALSTNGTSPAPRAQATSGTTLSQVSARSIN
jgi:coatomer subunit beta